MAKEEKKEYVISDDTMKKFKALPWKSLGTAFGIDADKILEIKDEKRRKQIVDALAYGRFTKAMNLRIPIPGTEKHVYVSASIRVYKKEDNVYDLEISTHHPKIENDRAKVYLYGQPLSESQVHGLRLTGQAGETLLVPSKEGDGYSEKIISINPETNELISCDAALPRAILSSEKFKGIYGVMPNKRQAELLARHKEVKMEGLMIPGYDEPQVRTIQFDVFSGNFIALKTNLRGAEKNEYKAQQMNQALKREEELERSQRQAQAQERQRPVEQSQEQEVVNEQDMDMPEDIDVRS